MVKNSSASFEAEAQEVEVRKLSHSIAASLRTRIVNGELAPGKRLLGEAQLIKDLKVSKPTLREALRILESEGLLRVDRGSRMGAIVQAPSMDRVAQYAGLVLAVRGTTLSEIYEVRRVLEPCLARQLASKMHAPTVVALRDCSERQKRSHELNDLLACLTSINEFHQILAQSVGNGVLSALVAMLHALSPKTAQHLLDGSSADTDALRRNVAMTIVGHRRLVELLESGDADAASDYWARYMERAQKFLSRTRIGQHALRPLQTIP